MLSLGLLRISIPNPNFQSRAWEAPGGPTWILLLLIRRTAHVPSKDSNYKLEPVLKLETFILSFVKRSCS